VFSLFTVRVLGPWNDCNYNQICLRNEFCPPRVLPENSLSQNSATHSTSEILCRKTTDRRVDSPSLETPGIALLLCSSFCFYIRPYIRLSKIPPCLLKKSSPMIKASLWDENIAGGAAERRSVARSAVSTTWRTALGARQREDGCKQVGNYSAVRATLLARRHGAVPAPSSADPIPSSADPTPSSADRPRQQKSACLHARDEVCSALGQRAGGVARVAKQLAAERAVSSATTKYCSASFVNTI
jgi:hypothetical protein